MIIVMIYQIVDLHHLVAVLPQIIQNLRQIFQHVLRIIVKQYDRSAFYIPIDAFYDLLRADVFPVEAISMRRRGK